MSLVEWLGALLGLNRTQGYLARKVKATWWEQPDGFADDEIAADAITGKGVGEIRTHSNTLSFWQCDTANPPGGDLRDAALAIAANFSEPEGFDLVWVCRQELERKGIALAMTQGDTQVKDLRDRHVDATRLDVRRLADIASLIALGIRRNGQIYQFTKNDVIDLLVEAVRQKRVRTENLKQKVREAVDARVSEEAEGS